MATINVCYDRDKSVANVSSEIKINAHDTYNTLHIELKSESLKDNIWHNNYDEINIYLGKDNKILTQLYHTLGVFLIENAQSR